MDERKKEMAAFEIKKDDVEKVMEMELGDMKRSFLNRQMAADRPRETTLLLAGMKVKIQKLEHKKDEKDPLKDVDLENNDDEFNGFCYNQESKASARKTMEAILN